MNPQRFIAAWTPLVFASALALAMACLEGCQRPAAPKTVPPGLDPSKISYPYPDLKITFDNYPKVDGSTSTQPLQMLVACKVFGLRTGWVHVEQDDTRYLWPSPRLGEAVQPEGKIDLHQDYWLCQYIGALVQPHGTSESYINLISKRVDLVLAARLPSDDELKRAGRLGMQLDSRPVALDAFVFLLNGKNPVADLTIEQIRDIYSGRVVNWRRVGGPDAPIRPYQRPRNSGSQELMQTLVMKGRAMRAAPDLLTGALMSSPFLALDDDVHGIAGLFLPITITSHEFMAPQVAIKACAVEGILPTAESIRSRRYPFLTEVYAVVRRDLPPVHPAYRLRNWLLEPTGQGIVEESGYVAVGETARSPSPEAQTGTSAANGSNP